jgi:predicted nucleic acid-binding protein
VLVAESLVVDASTTVKSCLGSGFATLAAFGRLVAPAIMWSEVTSTLREMTYRGEISSQAGAIGLARLLGAPIDRIASPDLYQHATSIARQLGWAKTYDAEYVALAAAIDAPLVTVDRRLAVGAGRLVRVVAPPDLAGGI